MDSTKPTLALLSTKFGSDRADWAVRISKDKRSTMFNALQTDFGKQLWNEQDHMGTSRGVVPYTLFPLSGTHVSLNL